MNVLAHRSAGAGTGEVRLYDGSTALATITGINAGAETWYSATGNFDGTINLQKVDIQAQTSDGAATTLVIHAVTVEEYEA
jgi:hypothetical protein